MGGTDQEVVDKQLETVSRARGFYAEELFHKIASGVSLQELAEEYKVPADIVEVFKTTHEIDPEAHVKIQAAFQKFVDSAVSKTINLPENSSWQDIARVYMQAYDLNCKGITVFRDGSKDPALQVGVKDKPRTEPAEMQVMVETPVRNALEPRKRMDVIKGFTYEVKTEQGDLYITINEDDRGVFELFLNLGKSGSFTAGYTEALGRLISMSLRSGIKPEAVIKQLQGIRTSAPTMNKGMIVYSVPDAIAKILKRHLDERKNQMRLLPEAEPVAAPQQIVIQAEPQPMAQPVIAEMAPVVIETVKEVVEEMVIASQPATQAGKPVQSLAPKSEDDHYKKSNDFGDLLECPECDGDLEYAEGCILCRNCGYSKCG
jgi:ribonucleoside-diphosphate reductase alpha chain